MACTRVSLGLRQTGLEREHVGQGQRSRAGQRSRRRLLPTLSTRQRGAGGLSSVPRKTVCRWQPHPRPGVLIEHTLQRDLTSVSLDEPSSQRETGSAGSARASVRSRGAAVERAPGRGAGKGWSEGEKRKQGQANAAGQEASEWPSAGEGRRDGCPGGWDGSLRRITCPSLLASSLAT